MLFSTSRAVLAFNRQFGYGSVARFLLLVYNALGSMVHVGLGESSEIRSLAHTEKGERC